MSEYGPLECVACGRTLTNDDQPNQAHWTLDNMGVGVRLPYCGDQSDCEWDAYARLGVRIPPRGER